MASNSGHYAPLPLASPLPLTLPLLLPLCPYSIPYPYPYPCPYSYPYPYLGLAHLCLQGIWSRHTHVRCRQGFGTYQG